MSEKTVYLGKREIGTGFPVFLIAEIGTDHRGELNRACALIDRAAEAGADCAKFQWVIADEIVHPDLGEMELPSGPTPLYRKFKQLERPAAFYRACKEYAEKQGLYFLCSVFGLESASLYRKTVSPAAVKIASPEINHVPLLKAVGEYGLPVILSTGMSTLKDIEAALTYFNNEVVLLHCVTSYPAPEKESNLRAIPLLSSIFELPAGLSDHSAEPALNPAAAAVLGAAVIEKHICLDRGRKGLDDSFALPPDDFSVMCKAVRKAEALGKEEALFWLHRTFGEKRVEEVLGTPRKIVTPAEQGHFRGTKRSVRALTDLLPGARLTADNCALLRSSGKFRPGIEPVYYENILGRAVTKKVKAGDGITWEDLFTED